VCLGRLGCIEVRVRSIQEGVMRNAVNVIVGAMLAAAALACGGDDESGGSEDPGFHNPAAGTGAGGFIGGTAASGPGGAGAGAGAGNGGNAGTGLAPGCAEGVVRASRVTPRVILVLDGSCSMSTDYPSSGGQSASECVNSDGSRWAALRRALLDPNTGVVTRLAGLVEFGLVVFGTQPSCPLTADPIVPALNNAGAIEGSIGQVPPGLYTPTGAALDYVYNNLILPVMPDSDMGPQIVVLATDGEPNSCDEPRTDYGPSLAASQLGAQLGVTTYVISLAGAQGEFHDHLQELANLGAGTGNDATLYEPSTPEQLSADLELLIGGSVGCDIALNGEVNPASACQGSVTLNGQPVACDDPNGWILVDPRHIRLQGAACDQLMRDMNISLSANFPCSVFDPD
jgi:hypothetical protein